MSSFVRTQEVYEEVDDEEGGERPRIEKRKSKKNSPVR